MPGIKIKGLSHHYGAAAVLNNIDLHVPQSSIYGLIGPNGAGKTTCLKLILGLLRKQHGEILFGEHHLEAHRVDILRKIGSLIEEPSIYAHLTARDNLRVWQKIYGCPVQNIDKALELVSLADTGNKKSGKFSLGMKQRLGLAIALLNDPEVLILDEPTNGLDPTGIMEIRELLFRLNKEQGTTILISSHLLGEVQKLVTHLGILHQGTLLFEGTLEQLTDARLNTSGLNIRTNDDAGAFKVLSNYFTCRFEMNQVSVDVRSSSDIALVVRYLVNGGIDVFEVNSSDSDLEAIFMDVIRQE
jgi:lantibiotic transport system ATP-binding protein